MDRYVSVSVAFTAAQMLRGTDGKSRKDHI